MLFILKKYDKMNSEFKILRVKMKFFKDNSYDIVKLYINNIGISIFSLMLYFAAGNIAKESASTFNLVISVFSIIFLMALVYCAGWDFGAKDRIHIDAKKMEMDKFKGLKLALLADIPNFVLAFLSLVFLAIALLSGLQGFQVAFTACYAFMRLTMSLYIGVAQSISSLFSLSLEWTAIIESILFILLPALVIASTSFGYRLGVANKRLAHLFTGKNQE